ncbi:MAG: HAMP domain-containing sensor histidine kinase [Rubrivivax sp.]|nr:HAMP domain-containing sensor histidine kinase [Rubrivivax sp.]
MTRLPSISERLMRALLLWALLWGAVLAGAAWLAVRHEVDELLDDTLQAAAEGLVLPLRDIGEAAAEAPAAADAPADAATAGAAPSGRYVWQLVAYKGGARVLRKSSRAPAVPLRATPSAGFSDIADWRVFGMSVGQGGRMLYVAQTRDERIEAQLEVALALALAGLPMGLLGLLWLRGQMRHELQPLQALSARLALLDPLGAPAQGQTLGAASRAELQPVHAAIDALAARLARRVAHERAFTAHAAHALRTPLAGIDAQLAVALRESPPALQARLQRVRAAAGRLQRVVAALLALFRSGAELQRQTVDLAALLARLPVAGLTVEVQDHPSLAADADLLSAALLNLLDNALRHGASAVTISMPQAGVLRVHDDGPGIDKAKRQALQAAIDAEEYEGHTGLGLMLADLVARAHGGGLTLPVAEHGFVAELRLSAA